MMIKAIAVFHEDAFTVSLQARTRELQIAIVRNGAPVTVRATLAGSFWGVRVFIEEGLLPHA